MASDPARKSRGTDLTPEQKIRAEAIRARHRSPAVRVQEARVRESVRNEYKGGGTMETTGDGTTMGDLIAFRRFVMTLRLERERLGLSLNDVAERARIDKAALSRLENGQQLNPTINTLARYARALGKSLTCAVTEEVVGGPASTDQTTALDGDPATVLANPVEAAKSAKAVGRRKG